MIEDFMLGFISGAVIMAIFTPVFNYLFDKLTRWLE